MAAPPQPRLGKDPAPYWVVMEKILTGTMYSPQPLALAKLSTNPVRV